MDVNAVGGTEFEIKLLEVHSVEAGRSGSLHILEEGSSSGNGQLIDGGGIGTRVDERLGGGLKGRDNLFGTFAGSRAHADGKEQEC